MIELCDRCGAAVPPGGCPCKARGSEPSLKLDLDHRGRAPSLKPPPITAASLPPSAMQRGSSMSPPRPPPPLSGGLPNGVVKLIVGLGIATALIGAVYFGVQKLRGSLENAVDNAARRPYPAPSRLVIASVTSDYS